MRRIESARAVLLLLGAENIRGAAIAGEKVLAILRVEQLSERLDAADDQEKIVLAWKGEDSVDEIVARAFVAKVHFQAVGEEGEEVGLFGRPQCREIRQS